MSGFKQGLEEDVGKGSVRGWGSVVEWGHPNFSPWQSQSSSNEAKIRSRAKLRLEEAGLKCGQIGLSADRQML